MVIMGSELTSIPRNPAEADTATLRSAMTISFFMVSPFGQRKERMEECIIWNSEDFQGLRATQSFCNKIASEVLANVQIFPVQLAVTLDFPRLDPLLYQLLKNFGIA